MMGKTIRGLDGLSAMRGAAGAGLFALLVTLCAAIGGAQRLSAAEREPALPASSVRVLSVRFSSEPHSSRIVLDLDADVRYTVGRLSNPERLYVDLHQTTVNPQLNHRRITLRDGLISRIRIAGNQDSVARVVLDLRSPVSYKVSELANPPRLLVELSRQDESEGTAGPSPMRTAVPRTGSRLSRSNRASTKNSSAAASAAMQETSSSSPNERRTRATSGPGPTPYGTGEKLQLSYAGSSSPRNVLLFDLNLETNYDDNVSGNNQHRVGDVGFLFGPSISLRRMGKSLSLALHYQPFFRIYRQASGRNALDQGLSFDSSYRASARLAFRARGSVLYTNGIFQPHGNEELVPGLGSPSSLNESFFTPAARQFTYNVRFDTTYQSSLRDSWAAFLGLSRRNFNERATEEANLGNTDKRDAGLLYRHRLNSHDTVGINYLLQDFRFGSEMRTLVHSVFFSFAKQISPSVTVDVFGGPEYSRLHHVIVLPLGFFTLHIPVFRTQWRWAVGGDLTKRTQTTVFQITAQRQVSDGGGLTGAVVSSYVGGSVRRRLPGRWDAIWNAGYAHNSSLGFGLGKTSLDSQTAGFGLERSLRERLSLRLGYDFIRQRASQETSSLLSFDRDLWYVRLSYRFEQIPLGR